MSAYRGDLVDAHHHFWEPGEGRQPWLRPGARIPFRYGDYESIKRDYLPDDLRRDAASAGMRLVGCVTMETEWDDADPLGEIDHIESVRARFGLPSAAIGRVQLHRSDAAATLEAMAERSIVRGIRHKPGQTASPSEPGRTLLSDPTWRDGYSRLAPLGLDFELQTAWWHLDEAADLVRAHPETALTINHTALPADRSREAIDGWSAAIGRIASLDRVWMKVSGIGVPDEPWTVDANREIVLRAIDAFGPARIMFASNFPVDSLVGTYAEILGGFAEIVAGCSRDEQEAMFARNAIERYRLDVALGSGGTDAA
ncbi:amidohydrolase family protein [Agrococcus sp. SGAir0287]|uniref:amidohydrolase family protein n=1 Tax=Agrococcus sp. SGAir0287 TaxID=2070347 RepID=UPI0010CCD2E7|nr:amidohydrolase family protein [Agrococcus sp. SGAir0287]QCR19789.1 thioesterase [Agrococcus sp. SGAir0287]